MLCLGIESTAHTFGCSVVDSRGKMLSDSRDVYKAPYGSVAKYSKKCSKFSRCSNEGHRHCRVLSWTGSWALFARWCGNRKNSCRILQEATCTCQPCPWSY